MFDAVVPSRSARPLRLAAWLGFVAAAMAVASAASAPMQPTTAKLKRLTIEELMNLPVVSASRADERWGETAAAVQVVTGDEILRSGAITLPQALRLAPNLHAAQVSSSYWTIGARGFNSSGTTSNKLLVMIDRRPVYSPLVSGTYWDQRAVFLPDIDHIEVVSGPGGAAWGANAVNGVINILTKNAADTQGGLVYAGVGLEERAFGGARYGGRLGDAGYFRVYAKHHDFDGTLRPNGTDARNRWVFSQTGFRADVRPFSRTNLMLQGELYDGWIQQPTSPRGDLEGGSLQARWVWPLAGDSILTTHAYYDSAYRGAPNTFADRLDTVELELQHATPLFSSQHRLIWGGGHRMSDDRVRNLTTQAFIPAEFTHRLTHAFASGEFRLVPERLRLVLGARFEENNYSGADFSPNIRLAWRLTPAQTLWGAVSRAVRTPARLERDLFIPPQPPYTARGNTTFGSEELVAYELGWKGRLTENTTASLNTYVNDYDGLRTLEQPVPLYFANGLTARTYGAEAFVRHAVNARVEWSLGYTWFKSDFTLEPWSRDFNAGQVEIADPEHQAQLHLSLELPAGWEADFGLRYVGAVPTLAARVVSEVPAYAELDARIGWVSRRGFEVSVVGTNLLDRAHAETGPANNRREIERSVHARFLWRF